MAEIQSSFDDSYNSDDDNDNDEQSSESPGGLVLDGPYAHIFLANFQRDLQQSVNAGKKAFKKKKNMNHKSSLNEIEEPPKHEPPANPLPAENLKSCIKSSSGKKKSKLGITPRKVTWADDVYDPTPAVEALDLSDTIEWPKGDNKKNGNNVDTSGGLGDKKGRKGGDEDVVEGGARAKGRKHKEKKGVEGGGGKGADEVVVEGGARAKGRKHKERKGVEGVGEEGGKGGGKRKDKKSDKKNVKK